MNLYVTHVLPNLEFGCQLRNVDHVRHMKLLERIQRRWTCVISDITDMPYDQRLRHLDLLSVNGSLLRADLIYLWKIFKGQSSLIPDTLLVLPLNRKNRGHCFKTFLPNTLYPWPFCTEVFSFWVVYLPPVGIIYYTVVIERHQLFHFYFIY